MAVNWLCTYTDAQLDEVAEEHRAGMLQGRLDADSYKAMNKLVWDTRDENDRRGHESQTAGDRA